MIKRTLYFGNPAYLSMRLGQLVVKVPEDDDDLPPSDESVINSRIKTIPIEDIGIVVLDNKQITITQGLLEALIDNNCAIISCGSNHLPIGLMLPLYGNTIQNERFRQQIDASLPLKKQLWQQTIQIKISNQASVLKLITGEEHNNMRIWARSVRSETRTI